MMSGGEASRTGTREVAGAPVAVLLTCAMAFSMMQLFLVGALGPRLVGELGVSRTELGLTTTAGFGVAALLSPVAGRLVDRVGPRRCVVALLLLAAVSLALIGAAPGAAGLLGAVALGGLPQALANPATNKVILAAFRPERRGAVTGWKQSGVQFGAFVAGLPLSLLAAGVGWRGAVWTAAGAAAVAAVWAERALPADGTPAPRGAGSGPAAGGVVGRLALFSLLLGCGVASVNTYLALFGTQRLGLSPTVAGTRTLTSSAPAALASAASQVVVATTTGPLACAVTAVSAALLELLQAVSRSSPALSATRGRTRTRLRAMRWFSVRVSDERPGRPPRRRGRARDQGGGPRGEVPGE